jgi:hypothetical protein
MEPLTAKIVPPSWEKQTYYLLSNGWTACEEGSPYGWFIRSLENKSTGKKWEASNGSPENGLGAAHYNAMLNTDKYIDLPDFAKDWRDDRWPFLVRKHFEVIWGQ